MAAADRRATRRPRARASYVERAEIVDVAQTLAAGHVVCAESDVALVGLHIAIKTASRPQWIWSTFEQVDNVPPAGEGEAREPDARDAGVPYAYFDPSKPGRLWPPFGADGALPVDWTNPPQLDPAPDAGRPPASDRPVDHGGEPRLLERARREGDRMGALHAGRRPVADGPWTSRRRTTTAAIFREVRKAPARATNPTSRRAAPEENLTNATMETYLQDRPSSCMACHQAVSNARGGDFVGVLAGVR